MSDSTALPKKCSECFNDIVAGETYHISLGKTLCNDCLYTKVRINVKTILDGSHQSEAEKTLKELEDIFDYLQKVTVGQVKVDFEKQCADLLKRLRKRLCIDK